MNKMLRVIISIGILFVISLSFAFAQADGGDVFLQGHYVEVGIDGDCGFYGTQINAPPVMGPIGAYHPQPGGLPGIGFVADSDTLTPGWQNCGDYFLPGTPYAGFGLEFDGLVYTNAGGLTACNIPGTSEYIAPSPANCYTASNIWSGGVGGLSITQTTSVGAWDQYFTNTVIICNESSELIPDVYFCFGFDPDQGIYECDTFWTFNTIVSSNEVTAASECPDTPDCFVSLNSGSSTGGVVAIDPSWGGINDPSAVYDGTYPDIITSGSSTGDFSIDIAFDGGDLEPGQCASFTYYVELSPGISTITTVNYPPYCAGEDTDHPFLLPPISPVGGTFVFVTEPGDGATIDPITGIIYNTTAGTSYNVSFLLCPIVAYGTALPINNPSINIDAPVSCTGLGSITGLPEGLPPFQYAICYGLNCTDFGALQDSPYFTDLLPGDYSMYLQTACGFATNNFTVLASNPTTSDPPDADLCQGTPYAGPLTVSSTGSGGYIGSILTEYTSNQSADFSIPNLGSASSPLNISGSPCPIVLPDMIIRVQLTILHEHIGDLALYLIGPGGCGAMELSSYNGLDSNNYESTIFTTEGSSIITSGVPPYNGTFSPEGCITCPPIGAPPGVPTGDINGCAVNGNWLLYVYDNDADTSGYIDQWSLTFECMSPPGWTHTLAGGVATPLVYSGTDNETVTTNIGPLTTSTYTITSIDNIGCIASQTFDIKVYDVPVITSIITNCSGGASEDIIVNVPPIEALGITPVPFWEYSLDSITWQTSNVFPSAPIGLQTVFVQNSGFNDCAVSGTINVDFCCTAEPAPTVSDITICIAGSVTLTATSSCAGTLNWYNVAVGGTPIATGSVFTPTITATTTYYVACDMPSCLGIRDTVVVTLSSAIGAGTALPIPNVCEALSGNPTYNLYDYLLGESTGGSWSIIAGNPGANFNAALGTINTNALAPDTYIFNYAISGISPCPSDDESVTLIIDPLPIVDAGEDQFITCDITNATLTGSSSIAGIYTWVGPGIVSGGSTLIATVNIEGTYTLEVNSAGCIGNDNVNVTLLGTPPIVTLSPIADLCIDEAPVTLIGGAPIGGSYTVDGIASSVIDPTVLGSGDHTVVYTYTDPLTGCIGTDTDIFTINNLPAPPMVNDITYCIGDVSAPLTATGTALIWYDIIGGIPLSGAPTPSTAIIGSTNYYVTQTILGCESLEATITVNVIALPTTPIVTSNSPICVGDAINLTAPTVLGASYAWTGPGGWSSTIQNPTIDPSVLDNAGTYSVVITVGTCVSPPGNIDIIVLAPPFVTIIGDNELCPGEYTLLTAISTDSLVVAYQWNESGNPISGATDNTYIANTAGAYTVIITNSEGCQGLSPQFDVIVNPTPAIDFVGLSTIYCIDDPIDTISSSPAIGGVISINGIINNIINPLALGDGIHTILLDFVDPVTGCNNTLTQNFEIIDPPSSTFVGLSSSYCESDPCVTLTPTSAGAIFSGVGVVGNTFCPSISGAGTFTITCTISESGCIDFSTQSVEVYPDGIPNIFGWNPYYCINDLPITLSSDIPYGTFMGPGISGNMFNPAAANIGTNTIVYSYTTPVGCTNTTSIIINVEELPIASFIMDDYICTGDITSIVYNGDQTDIILYEWDFDNPSYYDGSGAGAYSIAWKTDGNHYVDVQVTTINGCTDDTTLVIHTQQPYVEAIENQSILVDETVQLFSTVYPSATGITFDWTPSTTLNCSNCQSPIASPLVSTYYTVIVTDSLGCTSSDIVFVYIVVPHVYYIPNAFSPNGDGINDNFLVYGQNIIQVKMSIYNRWGEKVFESFNIDTGWDGLYKGKELQPDVFNYVVEITWLDNYTEIKSGNLTLIR